MTNEFVDSSLSNLAVKIAPRFVHVSSTVRFEPTRSGPTQSSQFEIWEFHATSCANDKLRPKYDIVCGHGCFFVLVLGARQDSN